MWRSRWIRAGTDGPGRDASACAARAEHVDPTPTSTPPNGTASAWSCRSPTSGRTSRCRRLGARRARRARAIGRWRQTALPTRASRSRRWRCGRGARGPRRARRPVGRASSGRGRRPSTASRWPRAFARGPGGARRSWSCPAARTASMPPRTAVRCGAGGTPSPSPPAGWIAPTRASTRPPVRPGRPRPGCCCPRARPGSAPQRHRFLTRNRLIAALSTGARRGRGGGPFGRSNTATALHDIGPTGDGGARAGHLSHVGRAVTRCCARPDGRAAGHLRRRRDRVIGGPGDMTDCRPPATGVTPAPGPSRRRARHRWPVRSSTACRPDARSTSTSCAVTSGRSVEVMRRCLPGAAR